VIVLLALGAAYLAYIVPGSAFWEPDESKLAYLMMSGEGAVLQVFPSGRFFPLGHQLFNLYGKFATSATEFHLLALLPIFLSAVCLAYLFAGLAWRYRVWVLATTLTATSVFYVSQSFIYMERDIIFLFTLFLLSFSRARDAPGPLTVFIALSSAFLVLYQKETAFLILLGFSLSRLVVFAWPWLARLLGYENGPVSPKGLDITLVVLCAVFVLSYLYFTLPIRAGQPYYNAQRELFPTLKAALAEDRVLLLFLCFMPVRYVLLFTRKLAFHPVWDALLVGVLLFYAGNLYLALVGPFAYYFAPGDFLFLVGLFGLLVGSRTGVRILPVVAVCIIVVNLPATLGYARAYRALSADYAKSLDFLQRASREGNLSVYVDAENNWPAIGLESALLQRGLRVTRHDKTLDFTAAKPGAAGGRKDERSRKLIYVGFYSFWWSDSEYRARLRRYQRPDAGFLQVYPATTDRRAVGPRATVVFLQPGTRPGAP
jgi:hypothetical protein